MIIDKILHEKHLGVQWTPFSYEKSSRPNQLQFILSAIDATRTQCVDSEFKLIHFLFLPPNKSIAMSVFLSHLQLLIQ